jgi:quercetin dioxygenase-like cupin family protein
MYIKNINQVKKVALSIEGAEKVWKQIPLGTAETVPNFSFRVFTLKPGGHTPYHHHSFEHLNYVIEGRGALVDKDKQEHPIKQGDFILVAPEETHNYKNTASSGDLIIICAVPKEYE